MIYAGLDPGLRGWLACVDDSGHVVQTTRAPTRATGEGDRREYDVQGMAALLFGLPAVGLLLIERQQPMPDDRRGAIGAWASGYGYGLWIALLCAADIPTRAVQPGGWKRAAGVLVPVQRRAKGAARETAEARSMRLAARRDEGKRLACERARAIPGARLIQPGCRTEDSDLAEAILLADLARRMAVTENPKNPGAGPCSDRIALP